MATRPNRLERITNLVLALLDAPRPIPLREIGLVVAGYPRDQGALRQAFERDKKTLREGGIPIAVERIDGDEQVGYRILPEQYYLPDLGLTDEETEALAFALAAVRVDGGVGHEVANKLGASLEGALMPVAVLPAAPALGALQQAIRLRAHARFTYRDRLRTVEGHGLIFKSGSWYLVARDVEVLDGDPMRTFRVDRIVGDAEIGEPNSYELPDGLDLVEATRFAPWGRDVRADEHETEVVVELDVREVRAGLAIVGDHAIEERHPDGSVRLRFCVGDDAAFLRWMLGLGDSAELVSPGAPP